MKKFITSILLLFVALFVNAQVLHIYGGEGHDVYLGSLNTDPYDNSSIWNEYGEYGSEYSQYSPWNEYASYPPVIVDKSGNFYGYLTVNKYKDKRSRLRLANILCANYEEIREDISEWYDRIFE